MDAITLAVNHLESINITTKKTRNVLEDLKNAKERFDKGYYTWSDWVRLSKLDPGKGERDIVEPVIAVADKILCHPQFQADVRQIIEGSFQCAIGALEGYETFKREHGLMDFIDQETRVLDLCRNNAAFKTSMGDRIQLVMVDEFQDTSPIQLALFLALNELAGHSVWVGIPNKQSMASGDRPPADGRSRGLIRCIRDFRVLMAIPGEVVRLYQRIVFSSVLCNGNG